MASSSALALIDALLVDQTLHNFFLLTTCRQEYLFPSSKDTHNDGNDNDTDVETSPKPRTTAMTPLQQLLDRRSDSIHEIMIGGLDMAGVRRVVNALLRMDADETKTEALAEIVHHKCDGNPFFMLQFMNLLCERNLLTYDWGTFSWNWLEGDIQSQNVASNVADTVQKRLETTLSSPQRLILRVASCIGSSFEHGMLEFVLTGLQSRYEHVWQDDVPVNDDNSAESPSFGSAGIWDLRVGSEDIDVGRLVLAPFVAIQNLGDSDYNASVVPNAFGSRYFEPGPSRTFRFGMGVTWANR